jgi:hypothetical protein
VLKRDDVLAYLNRDWAAAATQAVIAARAVRQTVDLNITTNQRDCAGGRVAPRALTSKTTNRYSLRSGAEN